MVFVFKASIPRSSFRFSDFLSLAGARAGPVGPGTCAGTDFDRLKQFKRFLLHMKENLKTNKKVKCVQSSNLIISPPFLRLKFLVFILGAPGPPERPVRQ